jgi:hypothetical protein
MDPENKVNALLQMGDFNPQGPLKIKRFLTDEDIAKIDARPSQEVQDKIMAKTALRRQRRRNVRKTMDGRKNPDILGLAVIRWLLS